MDFAMLGIMVLGGAFLWVNKDNLGCIFNPSSCGTGPDLCTGKTCPSGQTCDITTGQCGTSGGGDDPATCSSKYNGSCNSECGSGRSCGATICKSCIKACGESKAPSECRTGGGGSTGTQCGDLCNQK